jgi:putative ABC transport system permease protein
MEWSRLIFRTARRLLREPGFTTGALLLLALGIGLTTAAFGILDQLFWRPLPGVPKSDRMVALYTSEGDEGAGVSSYLDLRDLAERGRAFAAVASYKRLRMELATGEAGESVDGLLVSSGYFRALGLAPARGRFFVADEVERPGAPVAVLAWDTWQGRFGGRADVLGRVVSLDGLGFTVIGVAPPGFRGTSKDMAGAVFVPMSQQPHFMGRDLLANRGWGGVLGIARLAPGISLEKAQADLARVVAALAREFPDTNAERKMTLEPLAAGQVSRLARPQWRAAGTLLGATVGLVLLVACANVATLLAARAVARREELGVRRTLGATPRRLASEQVAEALVLAAAGGVLGCLLASGGLSLARRVPLLALQDLRLDPRVLLVALALTLASSVLASLAPLLEARRQLAAPLRAGGAAPRSRRRTAWVALQVALSLVLLVGTALFGRTLANLRGVPLGFEPAGLVVAELGSGGLAEGSRAAGWRAVSEAVRGVAGVRAASLTNRLPGGNDFDQLGVALLTREGRQEAIIGVQAVGGDYFRTLGVAPRAGRGLSLEDERLAARVTVVNESFVRRYWPGQPAVGRSFEILGEGEVEVVGVVPDSKDGALREQAAPLFYVPWNLAPNPPGELYLLARASGDERLLAAPLRETALSAGATRVGRIAAFEDWLALVVLPERMAATLLAAVSTLALLLTAVGLYSLLAWSVAQRTRELGVRAALGADRGRLRLLVLGQGLRVAALGVLGGMVGGVAAAKASASLLFGIGPYDPLSLLAPGALLLLIAAAAAWLPARRATRVDPMTALRA